MTTPLFDRLKVRTQRLMAKHRRRGIVRALHGFATYIENAYENDEWDLNANGEAALVRRLAPARFSTAFDVGAHVGEWSVLALREWPRAHVHAFEVAPATCERLQERLTAAGLSSRSTLNCLGLGDANESRTMYYYPDHPNLTCDSPRHTQHRSTPFQAQLVTGDRYAADHRIERINFVKIDVEGAEHLVLEGLSETIREGRIDCIQFEYGAFAIDTRILLTDYYKLLRRDYWIGKIYPTHVDFSDYQWTMENFRFSNFLCVLCTRPDLRDLARNG